MSTRSLPVLFVSGLVALGCTEARNSAGDATRSPFTDAGANAPSACGACAGTCELGRCREEVARLDSTTDVVVSGVEVFAVGCRSGTGLLLHGDGSTPFRTLATGSACPTSIAVGGTPVVAGLDGAGMTFFRSGDAGNAFVATPSVPTALAASRAALYYTTSDSLFVAEPDGSAPRALLGPGRSLTRPVVDDGVVWIGDRVSGDVLGVTDGDGGVNTLTPGLAGVNAVAATGASVFVAAGYVLMQVPKRGGAAKGIATADGAEILVVAADEGAVYFASDGVLWELGTDATLPVAIGAGLAGPTALAVTPTAVYVANRRGGVTRVAPRRH